ncbi:MAG: MucR family transcriptional regulator [Rhodospirillales bacterium]|nr:MAG: MucR family transcriptional regulator [Rhodospirillales bacterium]
MPANSVNNASRSDILRMTADVVAAYVGNNPLPARQVSDVISKVFGSLKSLGDTGTNGAAPVPAVPIRRSVTADHIICLEDGKKLKMLKRHLRSTFNMTPEEYRAKWKLPFDYPMVAPAYAKERSEFAKKIGLGRRTTDAPRRRKG